MTIEDFKVGEYYLYRDKLPPQMMAIDICIMYNNKLAIKQVKNIMGCETHHGEITFVEDIIIYDRFDDVYSPLTPLEKLKYL